MEKFIETLGQLWQRDIDKNISGDLYKATFVGTECGQKVLEDLIRFYYMPTDVSLTDTHQIAFEQGQREVVHYILRRLTTIEIKENNDE